MRPESVPPGWSTATIVDITRSSGGGTPSKADDSYWTNGELPWVSPKDMKRFLVSGSEETVTAKALDRLALVPAGSVLVVVRSGILSRTLPVAINVVPVTINQDMRAFVPSQAVVPRYVAWQLIANEREILDRCAKDGTTVASIEASALSSYPFAVAPAAEQARIVDKLEEFLSDLYAGIAELKAAQKKLVQYRQSLLKAAVEGRLTGAWRARHGKPEESGAQLLARILRERRARWEAKELARFEAQGKAPGKGWQERYPEPIASHTGGPFELPRGWTWATVEQLTIEQKYGTSAKTEELETGVPVIRMGNIQDGELDLGKLKYLPIDHEEFPQLYLADGDLLFNRTNSPELVGKSAVYRSQVTPCSYASYLIGVRLSSLVVPELVASYINSGFGRQWVKSVVTQQVGQANVNGSKLAAFAVPLPPIAEQIEISRLLSEQLALAAEQTCHVSLALRQSAAQRKNILQAAFSGQLVPQDPNDEPASVLLARIRAERVARAAASQRGHRPKKVKASA